MPRLPEQKKDRIAEAIYAKRVESAQDWRRPHLGASMIGDECLRRLWYGFRWAAHPRHDGRLLRLFERGDREEAVFVAELRSIGCEVVDVDPETGDQLRFSAMGGHIGGSCDGHVRGVPGAPKTWHVAEFKTSNDKRFKELLRKGVRETNPKHFTQMQLYMRAWSLKRSLYLCANKNDDQIYSERVQYDAEIAAEAMTKAELVVKATEPPLRCSEDPSWWACKFCDHNIHCHQGVIGALERNCRTCVSATPEPDGTWSCAHHKTTLSVEDQRDGCIDHLFIPSMLTRFEVIDGDADSRYISYRDPKTGDSVIDSRGIFHDEKGRT